MEKYYGNYLGIVVNSNDPENRNRIQVWIPNLSNTLYLNWNNDLSDKTIDYNFTNINADFVRLKNSLPWAECASPLIGGGTAMNINPNVDSGVSASSVTQPLQQVETQNNNDGVEVDANGVVSIESVLPDVGGDVFTEDKNKRPITLLDNGTYVYSDDASPVDPNNLPNVEPNLPSGKGELLYNDLISPENSIPVDGSYDKDANPIGLKQVNATVEKKTIKAVAPVNGTLAGGPASLYGASRDGGDRMHSGIDWQAANGSKVVEMVGGTVLYSATNSRYGANIVVKGDDGIIRRYATHGTVINPGINSRIEQGQQIGTIGDGHLHYEEIPENLNGTRNVVYDEFVNNPGQFVSTANQRGTRDPIASNGYVKGSIVQAGTSIGEEISANIAAQDTNQDVGESNTVLRDNLAIASAATGVPSTYGAAKGVISCPSVGARVWVFFYGGDLQKPVYFAMSITDAEYKNAGQV